MTEVTKRTTFKDVVPISSFITYVKHQSNDEIILNWFNGVTNIRLATNGHPESVSYKSLVIQTGIKSQSDKHIELDDTLDAEILYYFNKAHGYVWNETKNEVVRARVTNTENGYVSLDRGLFGTKYAIWEASDVLLFLNVLTLGAVTITAEGEWNLRISRNPSPGDILSFTYGGRTTKYTLVDDNPSDNEILIGDSLDVTSENIANKLDMDYTDYTHAIVSDMAGVITIVQGDYAGYVLGSVTLEGEAEGALTVETIVYPRYSGFLGSGMGTVDMIPDIGIGQKLISP